MQTSIGSLSAAKQFVLEGIRGLSDPRESRRPPRHGLLLQAVALIHVPIARPLKSKLMDAQRRRDSRMGKRPLCHDLFHRTVVFFALRIVVHTVGSTLEKVWILTTWAHSVQLPGFYVAPVRVVGRPHQYVLIHQSGPSLSSTNHCMRYSSRLSK